MRARSVQLSIYWSFTTSVCHPNSLAANSLNSQIAGRYVFNVRNGQVVGPALVPVPAGLMIGLLGGAGLFGFRRTRRA